MTGRLTALLVLAGLLLPAPAAVAVGCRKTSVAAMENDVMCLVCGVPLALADAPQAQRERAFIQQMVAECKSRSQIEAALVAQYGPRVLALPSASGFRLAAYLVPALGVAAAALALALAALTIRRRAAGTRARAPAAARTVPRDPIAAARLDDELEHFRG
jgi:cytochrome c-type biogenesis protein CcmH